MKKTDKQFWVDFNASILVEAENEEKAKEIFYETYPRGIDFVNVIGVEPVYDEKEGV